MAERPGFASTPTPATLAELAMSGAWPRATIYLPLDRRNPGASADRIRLKDLVREVSRELAALTLDHAAIDEFIGPLARLRYAEMWKPGARGWGLFRAPDRWIRLDLPADVPPLAFVGDRFVLTPLLAAMPPSGRYYLLALSQRRTRLFFGDFARLDEVAVDGLPASLSDALWYEESERQINVHGGGSRGIGGRLTTTYGSVSERDAHDDRLLRFFRIVDDLVAAAVTSGAPLVVAGVAYELAIYRRATRHPRLACLPLGNPDGLGPVELHDRSWALAREALDEARKERLGELERSSEPASSLPAVLTACRERRVATLFVRPDRLAWGTVDDDGVSARTERRPGDIELYSAAIEAAIGQGATVYPLWPGELDDRFAIAAGLRY